MYKIFFNGINKINPANIPFVITNDPSIADLIIDGDIDDIEIIYKAKSAGINRVVIPPTPTVPAIPARITPAIPAIPTTRARHPVTATVNRDTPKIRRAILIGIEYTSGRISRLNGCHYDIKRISSLLRSPLYGYTKDEIITCMDEGGDETTTNRDAIMATLRQTVSIPNLDELILYYSGHGSQQRDRNGDETVDKRDEVLVPSDLRPIVDDDIYNQFISRISPKTKTVCIIDACHSASILDMFTKDTSKSIVCISGSIDSSVSYSYYDEKTKKWGGVLTQAILALNDTTTQRQQKGDSINANMNRIKQTVTTLGFGEGKQQPVLTVSNPAIANIRGIPWPLVL